MGKSFNDDVFSGIDNLNINGLSITPEAIQENKGIDSENINQELDDNLVNQLVNQYQKTNLSEDDIDNEKKILKEQLKDTKSDIKVKNTLSKAPKGKSDYIPRSLRIKKDYSYMINGLSILNDDLDIRLVVNRLFERAIESINKEDKNLVEKAIKIGKENELNKNDDIKINF